MGADGIGWTSRRVGDGMVQDEPGSPVLEPHELGIGRLFDHVRDAVVVADVKSGRIVLWNSAAADLLGYSHSEALDLQLEALVPERLRAKHCAGIAHYVATGHGPLTDSGTPVTVPALHRSGQEVLVELTLSPIDDTQRRGRFVLAILRDVTERAERSRLEGALLAARTMEHELGNQLAATCGWVEWIAQDPSLPPHLKERAARAVQGAHNAMRMLRQLQELISLPPKHWGPTAESTIDLDDQPAGRSDEPEPAS
jgi:PAS domain S-box-containing protein